MPIMRVLFWVLLVCQFCSAQAARGKPQFTIPAPIPKHKDECARTAQMRIYSNAVLIEEEAGDVVGYELAIGQSKGSAVDALLYFYESTPNDEGIPISGRISGNELSLGGNWVVHLIEYPLRKAIIETHSVIIDGTLNSAWFRGRIEIEGQTMPTAVRLKRVDRIWLCKQ